MEGGDRVRALVVGAGRLGRALAEELLHAGHEVRILEGDGERLARLPATLAGCARQGSPLDRESLAGALGGCDGVATTTRDDALNTVVALAARRQLGVPLAVAVVHGPARAEALVGLGVHVVCPTVRTASELHLALIRSGVESELHLGDEAGVYRIELPARLAGRPLLALGAPGSVVPVALERDGRVLLARPELVTADGDVLHVAAAHHDLVAGLVQP
jgi:trk system potassium uptake protein TrkA